MIDFFLTEISPLLKNNPSSEKFNALIKRVAGQYDVMVIRRLDLEKSNIRSMKGLNSFVVGNALIDLNLSHNSICSIEALVGLTNLERLDLSFNSIKEIPKGAFNRSCKLQTLRLDGNDQLGEIFSIRRLENIGKTLSRLSFQCIGGIGACQICHLPEYHKVIFQTLPNLVILDYGSVQVAKVFTRYKEIENSIIPLRSSIGSTADGCQKQKNKTLLLPRLNAKNFCSKSILNRGNTNENNGALAKRNEAQRL